MKQVISSPGFSTNSQNDIAALVNKIIAGDSFGNNQLSGILRAMGFGVYASGSQNNVVIPMDTNYYGYKVHLRAIFDTVAFAGSTAGDMPTKTVVFGNAFTESLLGIYAQPKQLDNTKAFAGLTCYSESVSGFVMKCNPIESSLEVYDGSTIIADYMAIGVDLI